MQTVTNFLFGSVHVTARGRFPERLLNLCAQEGVVFWGVEWPSENVVEFTLRQSGCKRLYQLAERVGCTVEEHRRRGVPQFAARFRRRYAFLVGLALSLLAVSVLSSFVLTIEVTGNKQVPTGEILTVLRSYGVRPGTFGPAIERKQIAQDALGQLEGLSWMSINWYGTRLEVTVREVVEKPEVQDETGFYDVVAGEDGLITHVEASEGDALVQEGDTVQRGDVLISGIVTLEPPIYSDLPPRYYTVHARGKVYARTWHTLTAMIPLESQVKAYTGAEKSLWSLSFFGSRLEFYRNSSISMPSCDKITKVYSLKLPGGVTLPVSLNRETFRAYELETAALSEAAAQDLLEERLLERLEGRIGEEGEIVSTHFRARVLPDRLEVTLEAECTQEIARETPSTREIPAPAG